MTSRSPRDTAGPGRTPRARRAVDARRAATRAAAVFDVPPPGAPLPAAAPSPPPGAPLPRAEAIAAARSAVRASQYRGEPVPPEPGGAQRAERVRAASPDADDGPATDAPPRAGARAEAVRAGASRTKAALPQARVEAPPAGQDAPAPSAERPTGPGPARWALRERLPLWLQTRCAVEPRALAALLVVLLVAGGFAVHTWWDGRPEPVGVPVAAAATSGQEPSRPLPRPSAPPGEPPPRADGHVLVDVAGRVEKPGVHRLPAGARVADALEAAGGVRRGTDTVALNRARVLADGEHLLVGVTPPPGTALGPRAAGAPGSGLRAGRISLNAATEEQLDSLPGIGPVLARKIVEYRTERGGFRSVGQLREVSGIGDSRFAELEPRVAP
ncbi:ComEA family DNA-binding protein [Streptomyces sp. WMMC897]|uniref:ComEA family DNA-binding protein n=1 Tax=Streptomyces sp. WMMC897 TaxID=3014782 RepID=UPI0022B6474B|nr:ComEA family DNA-binding protein [Streptomyces sp. WMMC897]MCZ7414183.1 ComEA family DNA-binding protein [Streptomyces sp. WMMC897]